MASIKLEVKFFCTEQGAEPVRAWLSKLSKEEKLIIGTDLKMIQMCWPIGMPLVKPVSNGLWEARSSLPQRKISRIFFVIQSNAIILLHGFIKKSQKTPHQELELAKKRKRQMERVYEKK